MSAQHELTKLRVTKIDAARRQLETAITLWFHEADPVSIHTLACASFQLIYDINAQVGNSQMFPDRVAAELGPTRREHWHKFIREAQNFFKHARRDAPQTFAFNTDQTVIFIFECCQKYYEIAHEDLPLMKLFTFYLRLNDPAIFGYEDPQQDVIDKPSIQRLKSLSKREFFNHVLPIVSGLKTAS
jgi:hypothetical protein